MHNRALHDSLAAFVEEAARQLADEVNGGAEVPFELIEQGSAHSPLYCYRPLTGRFIGERIGVLARLPSYPAAVQGLAALPDLPAYLKARGRRPPGPDRRSQADASLQAFLTAVWSDATDFTFDPPRFAQAFGEAGRLPLDALLGALRQQRAELPGLLGTPYLGRGEPALQARPHPRVCGRLLLLHHGHLVVLPCRGARREHRGRPMLRNGYAV